jgi:hypothetical protein
MLICVVAKPATGYGNELQESQHFLLPSRACSRTAFGGQAQTGFGVQQTGFGAAKPAAFGAQQTGFGAQQPAFGSQLGAGAGASPFKGQY